MRDSQQEVKLKCTDKDDVVESRRPYRVYRDKAKECGKETQR